MQELHRPICPSRSVCKTFWLDARAGGRASWRKDFPGATGAGGGSRAPGEDVAVGQGGGRGTGELPGFSLLPVLWRGEGGDARGLELCGGLCGVARGGEAHFASSPPSLA